MLESLTMTERKESPSLIAVKTVEELRKNAEKFGRNKDFVLSCINDIMGRIDVYQFGEVTPFGSSYRGAYDPNSNIILFDPNGYITCLRKTKTGEISAFFGKNHVGMTITDATGEHFSLDLRSETVLPKEIEQRFLQAFLD